jgi:hypothetical protein
MIVGFVSSQTYNGNQAIHNGYQPVSLNKELGSHKTVLYTTKVV